VRYHLERGRYCGLSHVSFGQGVISWRSSEGNVKFEEGVSVMNRNEWRGAGLKRIAVVKIAMARGKR
jgi:hypothetical protein